MVLSQSGEAWWYNMQDINSAIRQLERSAHKYEGEGKCHSSTHQTTAA